MDLCEPCQRIRFNGPFSRSRPEPYRRSGILRSVNHSTIDDGLDYEGHHRGFTELESCANQPNGCRLCKVFMWCCRKKGEANENHSLHTKTFSLENSKTLEIFLLDPFPREESGNSGMHSTRPTDSFSLNSFSESKPKDSAVDHLLAKFRRLGEPFDILPMVSGLYKYEPTDVLSSESRRQNWFARVLLSPQDSTENKAVLETKETNFCDSIHINRAQEWISECLKDHAACKEISGQEKCLPTRALKVKSESSVFLQKTQGRSGNYVALSYCWGDAKQVKLRADSLSEFENGISVSTLPKTIQDAISITWKLGFDYLWVDVLCIVQDSKEDLNREKARMDIVYSDATVTLFATNGLSADDGIFSCSHSPWTCSISVREDGTTTKTFSVRGEVPNEEERYGLGYPWNSRGWTLQEYISAPRGIVYTDSQMGWFCLTHAKKGTDGWINQENERIRIVDATSSTTALNDNFEQVSHFWRAFMRSNVLDGLVISPKKLQDSIMHQFYAIPNELNNHSFKYESDKLKIVANIAKTTELKLRLLRSAIIKESGYSGTQTTNSPEYWAGLWIDDWAFGFFWKKEEEDPWSKNPKQVLARPEGEPCVPSWSWASVLYSRHQSFSEFMKSAPTSHIRNVITPDLADHQERFIPTRPLPLRLRAPLFRISEDWNIQKFLSEESYNVSTGFEARLRGLFHISWDWTSFLQGESKSEWRKKKKKRKRSLSSKDKQQYAIIQVLSWEVAPLFYEEAFYLILERIPQLQKPSDPSIISKTLKRYRRVASLSERGVLPVKDGDDKLRAEFESWKNRELYSGARKRSLSDHLDRNKYEPTRNELILPSLVELVRRDPWPEIEIELV